MRVPSPGLLLRSAAIVVAGVLPVGLAWYLAEGTAAETVYQGMIVMLTAATRVGTARQVVIGLVAGLAAGAGTLAAGRGDVLVLLVVAVCLAEWLFNTWSESAAALLPYVVYVYWLAGHGDTARIAVGIWIGAGSVIALSALVRVFRTPPEPVSSRAAGLHAVILTAGSLLIIWASQQVGLHRGYWALLTFCLVFSPAVAGGTARGRARMLGTLIGAGVAAVVALSAPTLVCLILAAACAVLTVAYAPMPDDLLYAVFLTPTVLLLFGGGQFHSVFILAAERVGMTVAGGILAALLAALLTRTLRQLERTRTG